MDTPRLGNPEPQLRRRPRRSYAGLTPADVGIRPSVVHMANVEARCEGMNTLWARCRQAATDHVDGAQLCSTHARDRRDK